jgi:hypothetical protein
MPSERRLLGQEMKQESNHNPEGRDQQKREQQTFGKAQTDGRIRRVPVTSVERYALSNCSSRVSAHMRSRYYTVKDGPMVARAGLPPIRDSWGGVLNSG